VVKENGKWYTWKYKKEINLLVIKKETSFQIASEIGKLFKGHNIVAYKSPEEHLDIDTFYKM